MDFNTYNRLCIDLETYDPDLLTKGPGVRTNGYIIGIALGFENGPRVYYGIRHEGGGNYDPNNLIPWLREQCYKFEGEVVAANILYDLDYLAEEGITFPNAKRFIDVQVVEAILNEHRSTYKLDQLALDYLGEGKDESELESKVHELGYKDAKSNMWRLHAEHVRTYAESDVDRPLRILEQQLKEISNQNLDYIYDLECRLTPVLLMMKRNGVRIDLDRANQLYNEFQKSLNYHQKQLNDLAGEEIEIWAPEKFADVIRQRGIEVPVTQKTGKPSITKTFISKNQDDNFLYHVGQARAYDKYVSTFLDGHVFGSQVNGRIHCEYHQLRNDNFGNEVNGTPARFSSSKPNLQQIPKRKEESKFIRRLFIPEEGEEWVSLDYSQIEPRIAFHYSDSRGGKLRQLLNDNPDMNAYDAFMQFIGKYLEKSTLKETYLGASYGEGLNKLAGQLGVSFEEAKNIAKIWNEQFGFIKKISISDEKIFDDRDNYSLAYKAKQRAEKKGFITTWLGRRQRFPFWQSKDFNQGWQDGSMTYEKAVKKYGAKNIKRADTHKALNRLIQGTAGGDVIKKAMVDIYEAGVTDVVTLLLSVHDELDVSRPRTNEGEEAVKELKHIMETCVKFRVPLKAEVERGPNWGDVG